MPPRKVYQPIARLTKEQLLSSLRGAVCPGCSSPKTPGHSFCFDCYSSLPKRMQSDLHLKFGSGYEPAVNQALDTLARLGIRSDSQPSIELHPSSPDRSEFVVQTRHPTTPNFRSKRSKKW